MDSIGHKKITIEGAAAVNCPGLRDARLATIISANLAEDSPENQSKSAKHFDNCAFHEGQRKIEGDWAAIVEQADRFSYGALWALGRRLHTVQDFYAHSNWVELHLESSPVPVWDLDAASLPLGILSGTWTAGEPKHCRWPSPTHEALNKDKAESKLGRKVVRHGPNEGKTHWDLARQAAVDATTREVRRFLEGVTTYRVTTKTGDRDGAGTDASVFIVLHGPGGVQSGKIFLDNIDLNDFEEGNTDEFWIGVPRTLGEIQAITIGYELNEPLQQYPGWYLEAVTVEDVEAGRSWVFKCDRWLATDEGDGKTVIDLPCAP